jgi:hypothetical protein
VIYQIHIQPLSFFSDTVLSVLCLNGYQDVFTSLCGRDVLSKHTGFCSPGFRVAAQVYLSVCLPAPRTEPTWDIISRSPNNQHTSTYRTEALVSQLCFLCHQQWPGFAPMAKNIWKMFFCLPRLTAIRAVQVLHGVPASQQQWAQNQECEEPTIAPHQHARHQREQLLWVQI